jgi:hypothetical protein
MKATWMVLGLGLGLACGSLHAGKVTLTDGSSLSGDLKEQANGDVVVATGAGEITVAKEKIRSVIKDGSASSGASSSGSIYSGTDNSYVEGVEARRAKYGNKDGLPQTQNLQKDQFGFTVGMLNYTGDAYTATSSELSGISYGLEYAHSFTDYVALETWGDYSSANKEYDVAGTKTTLTLQRFNIGIGPKVQKAINLGAPEQNIMFIPSIGLSPVFSSAQGSGLASFNSNSLGASLNVGLDFQFGGALILLKARYLVSTDVGNNATGGLHSSNTSAFLPQAGVGFAF